MAWTDYAPRFLGPTYLERDRANPLRLAVHNGQSQVTPTSGTFSLYDATNTAVVSASAVTITDSYATITVAAATLTSKSLGAGWRVEWTLVMPDGNTHLFRNAAALVRVRLPPAATEADLLRLHPDLRAYLPSGQTSWQDQLDAAWEYVVVQRLEGTGKRPYLVISQSSLTAPHTFETLAIIGAALSGGDEESRWGHFEKRYSVMAAAAWANCNFEYDETDSGQAANGLRSSASATVWLTGRGDPWGNQWTR